MSILRSAVFAAIGILILGSIAQADDLVPAPWRTTPPGQGTTTFQSWEFDTSANPAAATVDNNAFGDPVATITGNFPYTRWKTSDQGHLGVWRFEDLMVLEIPNNPVPNETKLVWLQLTYYADGASDPELAILPLETSVELISKMPLDDFYYHATFLITIHPNPAQETIYIQPRDCTLYVDEVVVDTICIPEPATLALLGLGLAGLIRRR